MTAINLLFFHLDLTGALLLIGGLILAIAATLLTVLTNIPDWLTWTMQRRGRAGILFAVIYMVGAGVAKIWTMETRTILLGAGGLALALVSVHLVFAAFSDKDEEKTEIVLPGGRGDQRAERR
jgi:tryptophan-rich sensory protein